MDKTIKSSTKTTTKTTNLQQKRNSTTLSGANRTAAGKSTASRNNNKHELMTPSTQAGYTTAQKNSASHGQEYMGSNQVPWGGPGTPMDPRMHKSNQAPELQNLQEPKYVKNSNLTASNSINQFQTPSRALTKSMALKTTKYQTAGRDPIGPGTYDVEKSLEFTKPRNPSPDLGHQVERQSPARLDSISPDQYEPNKEFTMYQSPRWTIGPKQGPLLDGEDHDMVNMEEEYEQNNVGYSFANQKDNLIPATATNKARPKSTLNNRTRRSTQVPTKASRGRGAVANETGELDSYNEPQKFGSSAKGVAAFGAPKQSAATIQKSSRFQSRRSTAQHSRTTAMTRNNMANTTDGLSMTQVVFQEEAGPDIQEEQVTKTRDVNRDKATKSGRPSTAMTAQITPKKVQLKSQFNNGKASKKKVPGVAPGQYDTESAAKLTHKRSRTALIGNKTGRPDINKRVQPGTGDLGPGAYDDGKEFGKNVIGHSFGKPKPEVPVYDNRDYGYDPPEKEFKNTRHRSPSAIIDKNSPGRPTWSNQADSAGPGHYDAGKNFGEGVKGHGFGRPRPEKPVVDDRDYGYDPDREFKHTRAKSPSAIINKHTPARPSTFAQQSETGGPGQYDSHKEFGKDVKNMTFNKTMRVKPIEETTGPGQYDAERATSVTKSRSRSAYIGKDKARPDSFAPKGQLETGGPGQYDAGTKFGDNVKGHSFGAPKTPKKPVVDNRDYEVSPERDIRKPRTPAATFSKTQARPATLANKDQIDGVGPGQYDDGKRFNSNVKSFRIGEKRPERLPESMGPGAYSPERADTVTKPKMPNITMGASPSRPEIKRDLDVAPGQYDDGKRFNSNVKSFRIGEKRPEKVIESMGPGAYEPDRADGQTKPKMPNITMGASPSRPQSFAKSGDLNVAPGQYDDGIRFNSGVKGFRIGEKREQRQVETMGPGAYEPDRADGQTKPKMPNITMGGSPSRPQSFAKSGDVDVAPGQYDDGIRFNSGVKGFRIAEKREQRQVETMGPGAYDPDRADGQTKPKMPNITMGGSPSRPQSFAKSGDVDVAPGQYDDGIRFNTGVKGFRIAEKREQRQVETMGPGAYDPDRADGQTKPKMPNITMGGSPSRPQSFAKGGDVDVAPGQYDDGIRFNSGVKGFKIAEKREQRQVETMGPGAYDPDRADGQTKPKMPNITMGGSPSRPQSFAKGGDVDVAPGQYDDGIRFNTGVKGFRIAEKREQRQVETMGPGAYDPDRADGQTKPKMPNITMGGSPSRPQSFAKSGDIDVAPGQYDDGIRFNSGVKGFKIAEKREQRQVETMGPGAYDPDRADGQTKPKMPNITMGGSPSRPQSFAKGGDIDVAPGQYDDGRRFNSGVKGFKIGEKRVDRMPETMGPGAYDPDRADGQTMPKIHNINLGSSPSRPQSFAKPGDVDVAPGQYDDGRRFNSDVKGFRIGEKRDQRLPETMGPGAYDPDLADGQTKPKTPNINMGSSPSRPQSFAKGGDVDVAPGQYDDGRRFNSGVKGFKIGEKREQRQPETMGPGAYDPDLADGQTKPKIANINMGSSPSRPHSFAKGGDVDVAPGQYDDGRRFNSNVKGFRIGEKRDERVPETMGPGAYDPDRADGQTMSKIPNINLGSSPSRPQSFAKPGDVNVAPGQYDDGREFGKDAKTFTIAEKRQTRVVESMGPGAYDPDRANGQTQPRIPNINMGSTPSRPQSFAKGGDVDVAPGQYDHGKQFGDDVKGFTIPEKREQRIPETMGPGAYDPDRADGLTKSKTPNINLGSSPSRPQSFARGGDVDVAPGQYDDGREFGKDTKSFTIPEKRQQRIPETMGPGAYDPDRADGQTMPKIPNINMGQTPSRPASFAKGGDVDVAPGQYDGGKQFGDDVKGFTIPEKREQRIPETMGPGAYDPERADGQTKRKTPNVNLGSSPSRPQSFAQGGDVDVAPGQYDHGKRFGDDVNGFTIAEKRDKRIPETMGPGAYDPERADGQTKPKAPAVNLNSSPMKPGLFDRPQDDSGAAPGQYDDSQNKFGSNVPGFTIAEKRNKPIPETMGPGAYDPERADGHTKPKAPNVNLGQSPSRPETLARNPGDGNLAPGSYDDNSYKFGEGAKPSYTIGERRDAPQRETVGPGTYDPERAIDNTKPKAPNVNIGQAPGRPARLGQSVVLSSSESVKLQSETMQQTKKRQEAVKASEAYKSLKPKDPVSSKLMEPVRTNTRQSDEGAQSKKTTEVRRKSINKAVTRQYTKQESIITVTSTTTKIVNGKVVAEETDVKKSVDTNFKQSAQVRKSVDAASYASGTKQQNSRSGATQAATKAKKSASVGKKTANKTPASSQRSQGTYGAGRHQSGSKTAAAPRRVGREAKPINPADENPGPGSHDVKGMNFGDNAKNFSMGQKRPDRLQQSPGPGEYDTGRSDSLTKNRQPSPIRFDKTTGRKESPSFDGPEPESLPRFYQWPKELPIYTIGEKRPEKPKEGPGPGEYNLDDSAVKPRTTGMHQF